jgi:HlyD family secretion protein
VGASVTPASAPFAIVPFETLAFKATVDEADIARVEEGMSARILLDGIAATEFTAEVVNIGKESQLTATGGTAFPVLLRFQAQGEPVLLGMNGSTDIEVETIGSATTMPIEALLEDGDSTYVYTVRDGRARRTDIEVGRMTDTRVEILSGLVDSDEVIVSGVAELTDGARVQAERQ